MSHRQKLLKKLYCTTLPIFSNFNIENSMAKKQRKIMKNLKNDYINFLNNTIFVILLQLPKQLLKISNNSAQCLNNKYT